MHEETKTEPVRVKVQMGFTRNLGNFESMRVDVGIEDSARANETATAAFNRVYAFVENALVEKFSATEEELQAAKSA